MNRITISILAMVMAVFQASAAGKGHPDTSGEGWVPLFNGKDLTGFMDAGGKKYDGLTTSKNGSGWVVENGAMVQKKKGGNIWSQKRFSDFILDLEVDTKGNSGLLFRCDNPRNYVQTGFEMQVERKGGPGARHGFGAVYDCKPPSKPVGKEGWNRVTLTCKDNMITIVINGEQVIEMDVNKWTTPNKNPDGSKNKFKTAIKDFKREGHIGFQDHGKEVHYRNVKIKELK